MLFDKARRMKQNGRRRFLFRLALAGGQVFTLRINKSAGPL
jgi:hypothetical protein